MQTGRVAFSVFWRHGIKPCCSIGFVGDIMPILNGQHGLFAFLRMYKGLLEWPARSSVVPTADGDSSRSLYVYCYFAKGRHTYVILNWENRSGMNSIFTRESQETVWYLNLKPVSLKYRTVCGIWDLGLAWAKVDFTPKIVLSLRWSYVRCS